MCAISPSGPLSTMAWMESCIFVNRFRTAHELSEEVGEVLGVAHNEEDV